MLRHIRADFCFLVIRDSIFKQPYPVALKESPLLALHAEIWCTFQLICRRPAAQDWLKDPLWMWDKWFIPFGQGHPELLVGDPDSISRRIEEASKAVPIKECFFLLPQGIHDRDQVMSSLELFAEKVMPRFAD